MFQPAEMMESRPMKLHDGVLSTTTDVWCMLEASCEGDLGRVQKLALQCPALLTCQYDYTSPLLLAVREGHLELVEYLVSQGTLDPTCRNHPFLEPLLTMARDRGYGEIAELLERSLADPSLTREWGDVGAIEWNRDETQVQFQQDIDRGNYDEVEMALQQRPELALFRGAFWGEGILSMPAKDGDRKMLELLMRYGARVPDVTKWGARYYFKKYDIAVFLLENGMNPNHMNWRRFTLLHDMAFTGHVAKAILLMEHGADIDALDEEYQSTPLGYAAHWGKLEMVAFLLERGADPNKAGAPWATPLSWARKKGHKEIEGYLLRAGAQEG